MSRTHQRRATTPKTSCQSNALFVKASDRVPAPSPTRRLAATPKCLQRVQEDKVRRHIPSEPTPSTAPHPGAALHNREPASRQPETQHQPKAEQSTERNGTERNGIQHHNATHQSTDNQQTHKQRDKTTTQTRRGEGEKEDNTEGMERREITERTRGRRKSRAKHEVAGRETPEPD